MKKKIVKKEIKCRHTWTPHECSCDFCDMYGVKECTKCGEIKE